MSGGTLNVPILGRGGIPASGVAAVAVTVTAAGPTGSGFLTLHQQGTPRPDASNLNFVTGATVANLAVLDVSASGALSVFASQQTDVIVDVVGWFAAGGLNGLQPARVLDMRPGGSTIDGQCTPEWKNTTGETLDLLVAGRGGVPATSAGTVILNVTAVNSRSVGGFLTVHASGTPRPNASSLNYGMDWEFVGGQRTVRNGATANLVFAQLGPDGAVSLYTWAGTHLLVDVVGWLPGTAVASGVPCPIPPFDADTVDLEWIDPFVYSTRPADNDPSATLGVIRGNARVTPAYWKIGGSGIAGVVLKSTDGDFLAVFNDGGFLQNLGRQEDASNIQQFQNGWVLPSAPFSGTKEVGEVCIGRGAVNLGTYEEDCRPARPHEAISVTIPSP